MKRRATTLPVPRCRDPSWSRGWPPSGLDQEFFYDLRLAISVGLSIRPVLIGKARFHDLVPLSSLRTPAQQVSEAQVPPPLSTIVFDDVEVSDAVPRVVLKHEDVPSVVARIPTIDPSHGFHALGDGGQAVRLRNARSKVHDRLGQEPGHRGRADLLDARNKRPKARSHLLPQPRPCDEPFLCCPLQADRAVVEPEPGRAKCVHRYIVAERHSVRDWREASPQFVRRGAGQAPRTSSVVAIRPALGENWLQALGQRE